MPTYTYGMDSASTSGTTWTTWASDVPSSTATTTWTTWTVGSNNAEPISGQIDYGNIPITIRTEEQIEAANIERERKDKEKQEAESRAKELLKLCLTEEQRKHLDKMSSFVIESELGKKYRIRNGRVQNVYELDDKGKQIAQLCAHPASSVPDFDTMLAQKLMLETNEAEFLRIANRRPC